MTRILRLRRARRAYRRGRRDERRAALRRCHALAAEVAR